MKNEKSLKKLNKFLKLGNLFKFLSLCSFPVFFMVWIWVDFYISLKILFTGAILYLIGKILNISIYEIKEQMKNSEIPD
jgi:ABC-type protease/lipase transport system fused ATPase/permease subunit